ncbi:D-hexose-6-phosphate mutarotase [Magnetospira sp. QH-2]|uniref:D-hexose-6-phosphate mutarotase n=1 Tax=Magnetospira sp. (strain QH-2) TaxID=1288970 RepID=UPI0003E80D93|nr:D-hexose-6-phosphate mutarotase [Magnetospira sp. QH-2]CCQ74562.1 Putative Aldose 1-epimerase [Magnetospira sp. QH-2]
MSIAQLNDLFGIGDKLRVIEGQGGLPMIQVTTDHASAMVSIYAGQVLSYRPAGQAEDLMFLSQSAYFAPGKAIKGGVPVCWPWFGPDPEDKGRPSHGFVRNRLWDLRTTEDRGDAGIRITLGLTDTDETRATWDNGFDLAIRVTIGETLEVALITSNTGDSPFPLTQALHSYLRVGDIDQASVEGLDGCSYIDKMDGGAEKAQSGAVTISGETDRIYTGVAANLAIIDPVLGRRIAIASQGSASAVVWNPWARTAASMGDLGDEDYRTMLCVETTNAGPDVVTLAPGDEHRLVAAFDPSAI